MEKDKEQLFYDALCEIADHVGDSLEKPISLSFLCLTHGISNDQKGKLFIGFNQVLNNNSYDDLVLEQFIEKAHKIAPQTTEFDKKVFVAFIKAFSINLIPELYPFSQTL
ncbi:hypothetical protein JZO73_08440 [Enterococcus plantarum]|uniref:hypothetical protein n=1 Tax=Enterococcus plantarum TaxID=1077675 RepID=UPI001A8D31B4|nr:hypothetical protein [Enterococcus plantarum]MBO0467561.1 hypothetical protein [Enterococcus plantarum]